MLSSFLKTRGGVPLTPLNGLAFNYRGADNNGLGELLIVSLSCIMVRRLSCVFSYTIS